jgi:hypothetical protein
MALVGETWNVPDDATPSRMPCRRIIDEVLWWVLIFVLVIVYLADAIYRSGRK